MQIYLAVTPDKLSEALVHTDRIAHVAYRIGEGGALMRSELPERVRGGIMVLEGDGCAAADASALCESVWRECLRREYCAVLADLECGGAETAEFLCRLADVLRRYGRTLYVPECWGETVKQAVVLICTAISGGTLRERLEEARCRFGDRLALDLQRLRMEFPLPCPKGEGRALEQTELCEMLSCEPKVFCSEDLCAKYFTRECECEVRLVLFDDAQSLAKKLNVARSLGIGTAFLMYPEAEDLLGDIFCCRDKGGYGARPSR